MRHGNNCKTLLVLGLCVRFLKIIASESPGLGELAVWTIKVYTCVGRVGLVFGLCRVIQCTNTFIKARFVQMVQSLDKCSAG